MPIIVHKTRENHSLSAILSCSRVQCQAHHLTLFILSRLSLSEALLCGNL